MKRGVSRPRICSLVIVSLLAPASLTGQDNRFVHTCGDRQLLIGTGLSEIVQVDSGAAFRVLRDPGNILLGQKFLVERATPAVARDTVVLVRWRPMPDSPPLPWEEPGPGIEPGEKRFISGVFREPDHWAFGYPTVDVQSDIFPDPQDRHLQEIAATGPVMTADEVFDFCSLPVDMNLVERGDWSQDIAPIAWARESHGAWREHPAAQYLFGWARRIEYSRIRRLPADVTGTYAAHLGLPSGRTLAFYFRTSGEILGLWGWPLDPPQTLKVPPWEYRGQGYRVEFWTALEEEDLPDVQGDPSVLPCRNMNEEQLQLLTGAPPRVVDSTCIGALWPWGVGLLPTEGATRTGLLEPELLEYIFSGDHEVADLMGQWLDSFSARHSAGEEIPARGLFLPADGKTIRYHQEISVAPGRTLTLRVVRISLEVVKDTSG